MNRPTPRLDVLHDLIDHAAATAPNRIAVADRQHQWSYRELSDRSTAFASWLRAMALAPGARVIVHLPNSVTVAAILFGTSRAGAIFVPVDPRLPPHRLARTIADTDASLVITTHGPSEPSGPGTTRFVLLDDLLNHLDNPCPQQATVRTSPDDTCLLLYTSGSTSEPRGVLCPHRTVLFAVQSIAAALRYRPDDRIFLRLPLWFDYGLYQLLLGCLATASVWFGTEFVPGSLAELATSGSTIIPVVPSLALMFNELMERRPVRTNVRLFTNTGAVLAPDAATRLRTNYPGASIVHMFGLTECKRVSISEPDDDLHHPGSLGKAIPGTSITIVDHAGTQLPPGQTGEIIVTGPHVMAGYHREPALTHQRFLTQPDGSTALRTGDSGHLDDTGRLYFHGRADDIVKRHGIRMSTTEIEAAANSIPGVTGAAAIYCHGTVDTVDLIVTGNDAITPQRVLAGLTHRLEPAKWPDSCVVLKRLPLTSTGKIDRTALVAHLHPPRQRPTET